MNISLETLEGVRSCNVIPGTFLSTFFSEAAPRVVPSDLVFVDGVLIPKSEQATRQLQGSDYLVLVVPPSAGG